MKVLLREDVDNIGYAGEVHKVADGYGRNYLIPRGLAVKATPSVLKEAEAWRKKAEARRAELRAEYQALSERIEATTLTFAALAGESGKLYGSVTTAQVTDALNEALGTDIDRRKVGDEPLRRLGSHEVLVRLAREFQPRVTVVIEPEGEVVEEGTEEEAEILEEGVETPELTDVDEPEVEDDAELEAEEIE